MLKANVPVRRDRASYRNELARFQAGPGPFLSLYLDVRTGEPRRGVGLRLRAALDDLARRVDLAPTDDQLAAAEATIALIEDTDATLVALIDATGATLATGYPDRSGPESITSAERPIVGPLLAAEQVLVHHVVAGIDDGRLLVRATPRHGEPSRIDLDIEDDAAIPDVIARTARLSRTALVIVCGSRQRLGGLSGRVRAALPTTVPLVELAVDGMGPEGIVAAVDASLAAHVTARNADLIGLWRSHHGAGEAVAGLEATVEAVGVGRAGLVLIDRAATVDGLGDAGPELVEALIWSTLIQDRPVHLVDGLGDELADGVGVILADRVDPAMLAALLER